MKQNKCVKIFVCLVWAYLGLIDSALAQTTDGIAFPFFGNMPQYFFCLMAGIIMALAFQFMLSLVAGTVGIAYVHRLQLKKAETINRTKLISILGFWSLISFSLSLHMSSWLAIKLTFIDDIFASMTLSLIIWASFSLIMVYVEHKTIGLSTIMFKYLKQKASILYTDPEARNDQQLADYEQVELDVLKLVHAHWPYAQQKATGTFAQAGIHELKPGQADYTAQAVRGYEQAVHQYFSGLNAPRTGERLDQGSTDSQHLRRSFNAASWWLFASMMVSGVCSALGGVFA